MSQYSEYLEADLTGEAIRIQKDKQFTEKLDSIVEDLKIEFGNLTVRPSEVGKVSEVQALLDELSSLLSIRVGIPITIKGEAGDTIASVPIGGLTPSVLDNILDDKLILTIKSIIKGEKGNKAIDTRFKNYEWANNLTKSLNLFNKLKKKRKIFIDLDKANVIGFYSEAVKKRITSLIIFDYTKLFNGNKNVREISALFQHELGHIFNNVAMMDKIYSTNESTLDSFLDGNDEARVLDNLINTISSKKETDEEKRKLETVIKLASVVEGINKYNDEIQADIFAARFGYGHDLATALMKSADVTPKQKSNVGTLIMLYLLILITVLSGGLVALRTSTYVLKPAMASIFASVMGNIGLRLFSGDISEDTHEKPQDRLNRIKIELIRQIRTGDEVEGIKRLVDLIKFISENRINPTIMENIKYLYSGKSKEEAYRRLYATIEELSENDLYAQIERMKQLKGKK